MPGSEWIKTKTPGLYKHKTEPDKWLISVQISRGKEYSPRVNRVIHRKKTINKVVYGESEAIVALGKAKERRKGGNDWNADLNFENVWAQYEQLGEPAHWDEQTKARNKTHVRRLHAHFDGLSVDKIDKISILQFFEKCRNAKPKKKDDPKPLGDASIAQLKHILSQFFDFVVDADRFGVKSNPARKIKLRTDNVDQSVALSADQLRELLQHTLNDEPLSTLCLVGLASLSGLRRGEICGLRWQDVEWDAKRLNLTHQRRQNVGGGTDFVNYLKRGKKTGKTRAELRHRYAAMPDTMAKILQMVHDDQERILGHDPGPTGWVYNPAGCLVAGTVTNPKTLDRVMERVIRHTRQEQGKNKSDNLLPDRVRLHDLRHTHVSICLNGKVPITQVYASVGHKFSASTHGAGLGVYWHDDGNRDDIVAVIDELMKGII